MRRGGTVHSLQEKRLSGRQKKERDSIQPPGKLKHPVPVLPPCCKPLERSISDDIQDLRLHGLTAMYQRQVDTEAEYPRGYASSSSEPDETSSVSETSSTIDSG